MVGKTIPAHFLCLFMKRVLGWAPHIMMLQFSCKRKEQPYAEKNRVGGTIPFRIACVPLLQKMQRKKRIYLLGTIPYQCTKEGAGYLADIQMFVL